MPVSHRFERTVTQPVVAGRLIPSWAHARRFPRAGWPNALERARTAVLSTLAQEATASPGFLYGTPRGGGSGSLLSIAIPDIGSVDGLEGPCRLAVGTGLHTPTSLHRDRSGVLNQKIGLKTPKRILEKGLGNIKLHAPTAALTVANTIARNEPTARYVALLPEEGKVDGGHLGGPDSCNEVY